MKKFFIEIAYLSLGVIVIVAIVVIIEYDEYKYYQNKNKELNYATNKNWKWHNESQTIQISTEHDEIPVLRRVYMQDNKVIYASKDDDYRLRTCVYFITDCVPKSEIKTSKIFLSGEPKMLKCNSAGNILYHCEEWQDTSTNVIWSDNLDGFSFHVNFRWWDFSGIDRAITLSKVIE